MNATARRVALVAKVMVVICAVEIVGWLALPSWSIASSGVTHASPAQVWAWYVDTKDWPNWDHLVDRVEATGPFAAGAETINTAGVMAIRSRLVEVTQNQSYTEVMSMPLATLTATHELSPTVGGTQIIHGIKVSGPGAWLFYLWKRDAFQNGMDSAMRRLAAHAADGLPTQRFP